MKAIVVREYGGPDVLKIEDVPKPEPGAGQVLIRVRAASINPLDWRMLPGRPFAIRLFTGLRRPKLIWSGRDVAGTIEAIGPDVTRFKPGDDVFGIAPGTFAEYVCAREIALAIKSPDISFEQAAAVPVAGYTALQGLRDHARLMAGERVLVHGAAGGVGTYAVQIAKVFGAEVTGVCSTRNVELVRSIGADHVIDYTQQDFTRGSERYHVIFDCAGNHSLAECRRVMTPTSRLVMVGFPHEMRGAVRLILGRIFEAKLRSAMTKQKFAFFIAKSNPADLTSIAELMSAGKVKSVIVDPPCSLADVPQAVAQSMSGHVRGKRVVLIGDSS